MKLFTKKVTVEPKKESVGPKVYAVVYWNTFLAVSVAFLIYTVVSHFLGGELQFVRNGQTVLTSPVLVEAVGK